MSSKASEPSINIVKPKNLYLKPLEQLWWGKGDINKSQSTVVANLLTQIDFVNCAKGFLCMT